MSLLKIVLVVSSHADVLYGNQVFCLNINIQLCKRQKRKVIPLQARCGPEGG